MNKVAAVLLLLLPGISVQAQDAWSVQGRTNQVIVEHREFGDIHTSVSLSFIDSAVSSLPITVEALCDGSFDGTCSALAESTTCNWSSLPSGTRSALTSLLGGVWCGASGHPECFTATGTYPWGESFSAQSWTCRGGPAAAECNTMTGRLVPALRILSLAQSGGCTL